MAGILQAWTFRFRGKTTRIHAIVGCFRSEPNRGLAPSHIAKAAGLPIYDVVRLLDQTPELFFKVPRRSDGITRYGLASRVAAQDDEAVAALIARHERRETWFLYLFVAGGILLAVVVLMLIAPAVL